MFVIETPPLLPDWERTSVTRERQKKRCATHLVLRGSRTCRQLRRPRATTFSRARTWAPRRGLASGGKRNHEDLSDEMALVEAALKVYRGRTVAHSVPHKFRQRSRWRRARQRTKAPPVVHKPRAPRAQSCATRSRGVQMCVTEREMAGRNFNQCDSGREADGRRAKRRAKAPWVVHKPRAPRAQSCATRSRGFQCVSPSER